jgi:chromosomal replication initiator protein
MLATKVSNVTFETWVRPTQAVSIEDNIVTLAVASPFAREWIEKKALNAIRAALAFHLDVETVEVRFIVLGKGDKRNERIAAQKALVLDAGETAASADEARPDIEKPGSAAKSKIPRVSKDVPSLPLIDRYVFSTFMVGRSNRLAHAAAQSVAQQPGEAYNPLFIYGGPGLGKTHLLHAIAHQLRATQPEVQIAYVSGENFAQHYIASIRQHSTESFRQQYRHIDVWLVDDVQFIAGKEHTKEEFFHTFNTLYQSGKQIVIASDRSPRELHTMDERLRTRFQSGLIADIQPPEPATRLSILQQCCTRENIRVPNELLEYIASAIQSNVRALEGAVTKLAAYSSVMSTEVTSEMAYNVLGEYFIEKPVRTRRVTVQEVVDAVAEHFGLQSELLTGPGRNKDVALARHVAVYVCRELIPHMNTTEIGQAFGGRDHATIVYACQKMRSMMGADDELRNLIRDLIKTLATS